MNMRPRERSGYRAVVEMFHIYSLRFRLEFVKKNLTYINIIYLIYNIFMSQNLTLSVEHAPINTEIIKIKTSYQIIFSYAHYITFYWSKNPA